MSEWFMIETRDEHGDWKPVTGSGSRSRELAERSIESLMFMRPAAPAGTYRVARYVRDENWPPMSA